MMCLKFHEKVSRTPRTFYYGYVEVDSEPEVKWFVSHEFKNIINIYTIKYNEVISKVQTASMFKTKVYIYSRRLSKAETSFVLCHHS